LSITRIRRPLAGALGLAIVAAVIASCFVGRKSNDYECSTTDECDADRTCDRGYCVARPPVDATLCPAACNNGCDLVAKTCKILCNQPNKCNSSICPTGYACTIDCLGVNACDGILCGSGTRTCDINCSTANACGNLRCGTNVPCNLNCTATGACQDLTCSAAACNVACTAVGSCQSITCSNSCACNVNCPQGACGAMSCPSPGTIECTKTGVAGAECSSTFALECSTCP
jgi:hypothetical protein